MGYETVHVQVGAVCSVSRHNSERDDSDDALVDDLRKRLQEAAGSILADPRYEGVILYTEGMG